MKIDVHAHLAGVGTGGSGCWLSPRLLRRPVFRLLRWWSGVTDEQMRTSADQDWASTLARHVRESELDRAVALGFDGVYDERGELDRERSQLIVPPSWVHEVCRRHPGELLPGPSINPRRRDALERLDEAIERGAVLIKWLPPTQAIDPADPRHRAFYRRMSDAGVALLVHSGGGEMTFAEITPTLKGIERLRLPLELGVPVICAHSGVPVHLSRDPNQLPLLRRLMSEFPNLWLDNSGMANPSRFRHLARLANDVEFTGRTLYGSDFPVLSNAFYYVGRLGIRRVVSLERRRNPLERDVELKRGLGYPDTTLTRASEVLATRIRQARTAPGEA